MRVCGWRGDCGEGHSPSKASTPAGRLPPWGRGQVCLKFKGSYRKADPSGPLGSLQPELLAFPPRPLPQPCPRRWVAMLIHAPGAPPPAQQQHP